MDKIEAQNVKLKQRNRKLKYELDKLKEIEEEHRKINGKLREENKQLKERIDTLKETQIKQLQIIKDKDEVIDKVIEIAKEKIKRYESYINDLKNGNYPSPTIRQARQELIFRIREQEELLEILKGE